MVEILTLGCQGRFSEEAFRTHDPSYRDDGECSPYAAYPLIPAVIYGLRCSPRTIVLLLSPRLLWPIHGDLRVTVASLSRNVRSLHGIVISEAWCCTPIGACLG